MLPIKTCCFQNGDGRSLDAAYDCKNVVNTEEAYRTQLIAVNASRDAWMDESRPTSSKTEAKSRDAT